MTGGPQEICVIISPIPNVAQVQPRRSTAPRSTCAASWPGPAHDAAVKIVGEVRDPRNSEPLPTVEDRDEDPVEGLRAWLASFSEMILTRRRSLLRGDDGRRRARDRCPAERPARGLEPVRADTMSRRSRDVLRIPPDGTNQAILVRVDHSGEGSGVRSGRRSRSPRAHLTQRRPAASV